MARIVLHDAAIADGMSGSLRVGESLVIEDGRIGWIGPKDSADLTNAEVIDAGGATIVGARPRRSALGSRRDVAGVVRLPAGHAHRVRPVPRWS